MQKWFAMKEEISLNWDPCKLWHFGTNQSSWLIDWENQIITKVLISKWSDISYSPYCSMLVVHMLWLFLMPEEAGNSGYFKIFQPSKDNFKNWNSQEWKFIKKKFPAKKATILFSE